MNKARSLGIILLIAGILLRFILNDGYWFIPGVLTGAGITLTFFWQSRNKD